MAETRLVKYGDRTMDVPAEMTLDQLREVMSRHFPELADPQIDTQRKGDKTVYVFSKKAGRKGGGDSGSDIGRIVERVRALPPDPALGRAGEIAIALWRGDDVDAKAAVSIDGLARSLFEEGAHVQDLVVGLEHLPSAQRPSGSIL